MHCQERIPALRPYQIHVWYASIDRSQAEINSFAKLLSKEEIDRAQRFRKAADRERYLSRQSILRMLLSQYIECEPYLVDIRSNPNGKPYLANEKIATSVQFNVSHSDDFAMYALSLKQRVGVDIEKIRDFPDMLEIVSQHFTPHEQHKVLSCPEDQRLNLFYRFWTRKEAVLKAQGIGLFKTLDSIDVAGGEGPEPWKVGITLEADLEEFFVADIDSPANFISAVAFAGPVCEISVQHLTKEGLDALLDI